MAGPRLLFVTGTDTEAGKTVLCAALLRACGQSGRPAAGIKPVMITGASYGMLGTSRAQLMLRQMLDSPELSARIMPSSEYMVGHSLQAFDDEGNLKEGALVNRLDGLFADFDTFVDVNKNLVYDREHVMQDIRVSDLKNDL